MSKIDDFYKNNFDKNFDNIILNYDLNKYPFQKWILKQLQNFGIKINSINEFTNLHNIIEPTILPKLSKYLIKATDQIEFKRMINKFLDEYIRINYPTGTEFMVQRYVNIRMVFPNQDKFGQVLIWHQGIWVGNGTGLRTIWLPMTEAYEGNTMQMIKAKKSKEITEMTCQSEWSHTKISKECEKHCFPVTLKPGQGHLFTQLYVHGNVPNRTEITRMSIDFRILFKDGQYYRKLPGGYFRLFEDLTSGIDEVNPNKYYLSYAENNTLFTKNIPIHLQRLQIKEYCIKYNISFKYEQVELNGLYHSPILQGMITNDKPDALLMFSIYSLPDNKEKRNKLLQLFVDNNVEVHFVNENLILKDINDLEKIKKVRKFTENNTSPIEQISEILNLT